MTNLKTVLFNALQEAWNAPTNVSMCGGRVRMGVLEAETMDQMADRLDQAITDHLFDREKVANIFAEVLYDFDPHRSDKGFNLALDRLIEGLAGVATVQHIHD